MEAEVDMPQSEIRFSLNDIFDHETSKTGIIKTKPDTSGGVKQYEFKEHSLIFQNKPNRVITL